MQENLQLFHYTDGPGLLAILQSNTLRATHIKYLNDVAEYTRYFDERLPALVEETVHDFHKNGSSEFLEKSIGDFGSIDSTARRAITMCRRLLMEACTDVHLPFVTCFCMTESSEVSRHGLLSQWRGYGKDGGYALVFNAAQLATDLKEERERTKPVLGFGACMDYHAHGTSPTKCNAVTASDEEILRAWIKGLFREGLNKDDSSARCTHRSDA